MSPARQRKSDIATEVLLDEIMRGRVPPGESLPREVDLAERFDFARGTMREAIAQLRERGLVTVTHGRGQRVEPEEEWHLLDEKVLLNIVSRLERLDLVRELLDCRRLVEGEAAALAADRARGPDIRRLTEAYHALADAASEPRHPDPDLDPLVEHEAAFHRTLVAITHNRPLGSMLRPLHHGLAIARHHAAPRRARAALLKPCDQVLAAVSDGNASAARAAVGAGVDQLAGWLGLR